MDREEWNQKLAQARAEAWDPRAKKPPWHMVYYMSSHGWGHFTRSLHIVARLARNPWFATLWVVVDLPPSVVRKRLAPMLTEEQLKKITFREYPMDFGLSQKDAVTTDWERSRANARALLEYWDKIVVQEAMWLRAWGFHFVMCDIPALPFDAAAAAGILSFAVGNFTWDWIYNELPDVDDIWLELALKFRRAYDKGNVWFRLPFTQPDYAPKFEMEIPVGLLSQPGRNRRFELAAATGAAVRKPWVLLGFTSLDWNAAARRRVAADTDAEFFVVPPLRWPGRLPSNFRRVPENAFPYSDLVATCDVVLTKPGFGIFSDAIVNRKPVVFTQRPEFPEAEILSRDIKRFGVGVELKRGNFYAGEVADGIQTALDTPWRPKENIPNTGVYDITEVLWYILTVPNDGSVTDLWVPPPADWGDGPENPYSP